MARRYGALKSPETWLLSLVAYRTHSGLCCAVFFTAASCCHKIQLSGARLHLMVNLLDCFMAQRQIASRPRTGSRYCSLGVFRGWASSTRKKKKPSRCLFVSLWQTILPSSPAENWTETSFLTVLDGLCAWYSMCDQLKHTAVLSPICLKRLCIIDCCGVWMWCVILTMNHRAPHLFSSAELLSDLSSSVSRPHVVSLECLKLGRLDDRSLFFGGKDGFLLEMRSWSESVWLSQRRNKTTFCYKWKTTNTRGLTWSVMTSGWCWLMFTTLS